MYVVGTRACNWQWTADLPTMKVLMFSMCLEAKAIQDRVAQLGRLVLSLKPDFIALQNVNLEIAKKMAWGARYHLVQPNITYEVHLSLSCISCSARRLTVWGAWENELV